MLHRIPRFRFWDSFADSQYRQGLTKQSKEKSSSGSGSVSYSSITIKKHQNSSNQPKNRVKLKWNVYNWTQLIEEQRRDKMPSKFKESLVKELKRLSMKNDVDDDFVEGDDVSAEWKKRFFIHSFILSSSFIIHFFIFSLSISFFLSFPFFWLFFSSLSFFPFFLSLILSLTYFIFSFETNIFYIVFIQLIYSYFLSSFIHFSFFLFFIPSFFPSFLHF